MKLSRGISRGKWILITVTSALLLLAIFNFVIQQPELSVLGTRNGSSIEHVAKYQSYNPDEPKQSLLKRLNQIQSSDATNGLCGDVDGTVAIRGILKGQLMCPQDPEFNNTVKVFNQRLIKQLFPGAAILPRHVDDIVTALYVGREWGMNVTIKDGGHNPAAHSISKGGLMIDMQYMNTLYMDEGNVVVSEGGARWGDVHQILASNNRSMVAGGCPQVGVVGLILGGGVGWLSRNRGLASDNVLSMDIVFPNGTLATITKETNSELFWALRLAGGSNFGVVTKATFQTFPLQEKYFGGKWCVFIPDKNQVGKVMTKYMKLASEVQDIRLTVDSFVGRMIPTRPPAASHMDPSAYAQNRPASFCFAVFFDGPIEDGKKSMQPFLQMFADEIIDERYACSDKHPLCPDHRHKISQEQVQKHKQLMISGAYFDTGLTYIEWLKSFGMSYIYAEWISLFFHKNQPDDFSELMARYLTDVKTLIVPKPPMAQIQVAIEHVGGAMSCEARKQDEYWPHCEAGFMISIQAFMHEDENTDESSNFQRAITQNYTKLWTHELYQKMYKYSDGAYGNYADPDQNNWELMYYGEQGYKRLQKVKETIQGWEIFRSPQTINPNTDVQSLVKDKITEFDNPNDKITIIVTQNSSEGDEGSVKIDDAFDSSSGQSDQQNQQQKAVQVPDQVIEQLEKQEIPQNSESNQQQGIQQSQIDQQLDTSQQGDALDENSQQQPYSKVQSLLSPENQEYIQISDADDAPKIPDSSSKQIDTQESDSSTQQQQLLSVSSPKAVYNNQIENEELIASIPRPHFRTFDPVLHANTSFAIERLDPQHLSWKQRQSSENIKQVKFSHDSRLCSQWVQDLGSIVVHLESDEKFHNPQNVKQQEQWIDTIEYENAVVSQPVAKIMSGETVLITGGTGGIGQSTALALAILGAEIIITSRSQSGCQNGVARLENALEDYVKIFTNEESADGTVRCEILELEDVDSITELAERIEKVGVVILNAGFLGPFKYAKNPANVSAPLMVDHLGHFLLASLLLDSNKINIPGRIILVSSGAATMGNQEFLEKFLNSVPYQESVETQEYTKQAELGIYAAGKLSNMLYMSELNDRFNDLLKRGVWERRYPITVNVAVPSITVPTQLSSRIQQHESWKEASEKSGAVKWGTPAEAAMASVYLAAESTTSHMSGKVFSGCQNLNQLQRLKQLITKQAQCMVWTKSAVILGLNHRLTQKLDVGQLLLQECIPTS